MPQAGQWPQIFTLTVPHESVGVGGSPHDELELPGFPGQSPGLFDQ